MFKASGIAVQWMISEKVDPTINTHGFGYGFVLATFIPQKIPNFLVCVCEIADRGTSAAVALRDVSGSSQEQSVSGSA